MKKIVVGVGFVIFVAAVVLQLGGPRKQQHAPRAQHLNKVLPAAIDGWTTTELPIGANEAITGAVYKELRYDEYVHRAFSKKGVTFTAYLGYWAPGKMPARLVASHTPDRCFTTNGMQCLEVSHDYVPAVAGVKPWQGEWRLFRDPGSRLVHVIFWHRVNGHLYDYGRHLNAIPNPLSWVKDAFSEATEGNGEQYFIRLTSNVPFKELQNEAAFKQVMLVVSRLGLPAGSMNRP
jgi:hypothetical protein